MAATRLIALHINKGKTVAQCLADRTDYSQNAAKTEDGKYISSYECDPKTADEEFLLTKRQYQHITGRQQKNDIIAYQIRQSFKPGEITPEEANQVGYETAMRWTKGKHAFIVATHIDRSHIHNHIIYNSTSLDCTRKFKNFFLSGLAVQRLSDMVCIEHGLSIIEPKPYRERVKRTIYPKKRTKRDELCAAIDQILKKKPKDFSDFVFQLSELGYEFKDGKQPAFRHSGEKRFIRLRSLGEGYSQEDIIAILSGKSVQKASRASRQVHTQREFNLLIDIQEKMAEGKSAGYERWAKKYNRKEAARTVCLLKEKGISNYEELTALTEQLSSRFAELSDTIKANEKRMVEIGAFSILVISKTFRQGTPRQSFLITQFQNIVTLFWNFNPLTIEPIEYNSLILIKHKLSHVRKSNSLCILHFNCPHIKINLSNCTNCTFHVVTFTQLIGASRHWDLLLCTIFLI